ncbi:MAG TPA: MFS transporter [Thermomicrobiales bacterium]|jgi:MFS family permease|nr:MFS transporter [Chloroflexota bacterium]HCG29528.1 MFS transporter [Chloroflexota bacterium]HQZ90113.1 MFS transporter [Thermomicrobiales bacterium]HRA32862.1 MFS transporter [Thermomicrobiales bacterium]
MGVGEESASLLEGELQRIYRRTLGVVAASQILAGLGIAAGVTVSALLAQDMLGSTGLAGLPSAFFTLGAAIAAFAIGRLSQRSGRRIGLSVGYLVGAVGGIGIIAAAVTGSIVLLFLSLIFYGSGMATNLQARYAGTDLARPERRGQAVSTILVATTFGAVAGPNLSGVLGDLGKSVNIPELAGPFLMSVVAFGLAAAILFFFLRPDPLLSARRFESIVAPRVGGAFDSVAAVDRRLLAFGASVMAVTQIIMVAIMTMTPVHMRAHHHGLSATGMVIAVHIAGMYLPSPLSGYLLDRLGRTPIIIAAVVILPISGLIAAFAPTGSVATLAVALGLLGLGWNLGFVAGTAMITDATPLAHRASTQGSVDVVVSLSGAGAGVMSGVMVATTSYATLSIVGGVLALALIPIIVMSQTHARRAEEGHAVA